MDYEEVVRSRRSIRGFLKKPVPKALRRKATLGWQEAANFERLRASRH